MREKCHGVELDEELSLSLLLLGALAVGFFDSEDDDYFCVLLLCLRFNECLELGEQSVVLV